ncbi:MAG: CRTAC1 family protein [Blastocatellia bacterium]|nr:CRTAC1 family protein [Blastocatellia bacterium]
MKKDFAISLLIVCLLAAVSIGQKVQEPTPSIAFSDISESSGVSSFQHVGGVKKRYIIDTTSSGVGFIDYDRDGWVDIYFVNGGDQEILQSKKAPVKNRLFRNNHNNTFTDVTEKAGVGGNGSLGQGVSVADFNNDGLDDIYVTNFGSNILYKNNGDGTFTDVAAKAGVTDPRWSTGSAFGDYDGDGDLDLFVANYVDIDINKMPEPGGNGSIQANYCMYRGLPVICGPRGLKGAGDSLFKNNGDGTFTDVSKQAGVDDAKLLYGFQPSWIDYDNDGDLDIFVSNDSTGNYLYRNNGNGSFTDVSYTSGVAVNEEGRQQACMGVAWGDFNNDGLMDLYLTNFSDDTNTLYQNDGGGNFTDITFQSGHGQITLPYLGWGAFFFDFDNDGDLDIFAANGHIYPEVDKQQIGTSFKQRNLLFENDGKGKFTEIGLKSGKGFEIKKSFRGAAYADIDNDGDLDVVVNAMDDTPLLIRNDAGKSNNWISLKLLGTKSNRSAIGTKVRLRIGSTWQTAVVMSGTSYLSQNDQRIHFGLGKATKIDEVEITWPSGTKTKLTDLKPNQFLIVDETKGVKN